MMVVLPSVMEKLPPTSYIRMIDIWLIVGQLLPFLQVAILTVREAVASDTALINHHGFGRSLPQLSYCSIHKVISNMLERLEAGKSPSMMRSFCLALGWSSWTG